MREKWIDNAKGIAILLIIIGHAGLGLTGPVNVLWVFGVHLVMFFLLSGYTLKRKELNRAFVNGRFRRLMIPYFWTCSAVLLMDVWNRFFWDHDVSMGTITLWVRQDLIRSFFASGTITKFGDIEIGTRIGALWFLPAMFFATFFSQVLLHITHSLWQYGFASAGLAAIAMVTRHFIWMPFSIQSGMLAAFFLWIGYWVWERDMLVKLQWYHYAAAQVILLFGIYNGYCGTDFVTAFLNDPVLSTIVGVSGCLLIYGLSIVIPDGFLAYIGKISLTILCVHLFSLETLRGYIDAVLNRMYLVGNPREWMRILLEIIIAIIGAAFLERMKSAYRESIKRRENRVSGQKERLVPDAEPVALGLFLVLFLVGQTREENYLLPLIGSCVPAVFLFFAGFRHNRRNTTNGFLAYAAGTYLIPYVLCLAGRIWRADLMTEGIERLILYMLAAELFYTVLEACINAESYRYASALFLSVLGLTLARKGYALPFGLDIALYLEIYILAGVLCRKYRLLDAATENPWIYFVLSPIWVYVIYSGGADLLARNYGRYGTVALGAAAGITVVYMMAGYLTEHVPAGMKVLNIAGRIPVSYAAAGFYLLHRTVGSLVALRYSPRSVIHLGFCVLIEMMAAGTLWFLFRQIEKGIAGVIWKRS